jgi:hypothetical protein
MAPVSSTVLDRTSHTRFVRSQDLASAPDDNQKRKINIYVWSMYNRRTVGLTEAPSRLTDTVHKELV